MKHILVAAALASLLLSPACTDYATFVTATNIGISADVKTRDVSIGYDRTELFAGPGYPEQGEVPRAMGYINSDLKVFAPHIKQLYATGDAADLVTAPAPSSPPPPQLPTAKPEEPRYYGQRRPLVFATGANVGLELGFGAGTAPIPSSIKFGYNREEASIIPLRKETPTDKARDRYAPVLASMDMNLSGTSNQSGTDLGITQFFATGSAARNLAMSDKFREYFIDQARVAIKQAALVAAQQIQTKVDAALGSISAYFDKYPAADYAQALDRLLANSGLPTNDQIIQQLKATKNKEQLMDYLGENPTVIGPLADAVSLTSGGR